ncbi:MAG: dicarboxylate/amino acid:cation symporter [Kordiimonadaceae bacterium]|nr:dicarboxylate/amino acid:cation symporter [Kordiimonadaceae bacterium]
MAKDHSVKLLYVIIFAVILGVITGWTMGEDALMFSWMGTLFLNALKMILVPLIVAAIITGISSLGDIRHMGRSGAITLGFFVVMMIIASVLSITVAEIIDPGANFQLNTIPDADITQSRASVGDVLLGMISPNIVASVANMELLQLVVFSVIFGAALTVIGEKGKVIVNFFEAINSVMMVIVGWIMYLSPFGIFALVALPIAQAGGGAAVISGFSAVGAYVLTVVSGLILQGILLFFVMKLLTGKGLGYIRDVMPAVITAFSTSSSSATMPTCIEYTEKHGLKKSAIRFVIPLGSTIHMNGSAVYQAAAAIFLSQVYGISLGFDDYLTIILLSVLAAFGSAGIPQGGYLMTLMIMSVIGIPVEGFGLILSVDWFLDRAHTTLNVWGDLIAAAVLDRYIEE